jgi:hypothetical protein
MEYFGEIGKSKAWWEFGPEFSGRRIGVVYMDMSQLRNMIRYLSPGSLECVELLPGLRNWLFMIISKTIFDLIAQLFDSDIHWAASMSESQYAQSSSQH